MPLRIARMRHESVYARPSAPLHAAITTSKTAPVGHLILLSSLDLEYILTAAATPMTAKQYAITNPCGGGKYSSKKAKCHTNNGADQYTLRD